jgi:hypothetical protein
VSEVSPRYNFRPKKGRERSRDLKGGGM